MLRVEGGIPAVRQVAPIAVLHCTSPEAFGTQWPQETISNQQRAYILKYFVLSYTLFMKQRTLHFLSEMYDLIIVYKLTLIEIKILISCSYKQLYDTGWIKVSWFTENGWEMCHFVGRMCSECH